MTEQKIIPFDLEKALAGNEVITRNGLEVIECVYFKKREQFNLLALIKEPENKYSTLKAFNDDGTFCRDEPEFDLFMKPKIIKLYGGLYKYPDDHKILITYLYRDHETATQQASSGYKIFIKVVEIEVEE
ncbi:MAG TPA: hypothetical protein VN704_04805 [Verrucomicrobiae bacterium]|nr:hypothetical protein [Verrucomicrobiae bacterium]